MILSFCNFLAFFLLYSVFLMIFSVFFLQKMSHFMNCHPRRSRSHQPCHWSQRSHWSRNTKKKHIDCIVYMSNFSKTWGCNPNKRCWNTCHEKQIWTLILIIILKQHMSILMKIGTVIKKWIILFKINRILKQE